MYRVNDVTWHVCHDNEIPLLSVKDVSNARWARSLGTLKAREGGGGAPALAPAHHIYQSACLFMCYNFFFSLLCGFLFTCLV